MKEPGLPQGVGLPAPPLLPRLPLLYLFPPGFQTWCHGVEYSFLKVLFIFLESVVMSWFSFQSLYISAISFLLGGKRRS